MNKKTYPSPCCGCQILAGVKNLPVENNVKAQASACPCPLISDDLIRQKAEEIDIDLTHFPRGIEEVRGAMMFIAAQLENGNEDGGKYIHKHPIEDWLGGFVSAEAIRVTERIFGISGLSKLPVFPDPARLEKHIYTDIQNYSLHFDRIDIDINRLHSLGYRGAEGGVIGSRGFVRSAAPDLMKAIEKRLHLYSSNKLNNGGEYE